MGTIAANLLPNATGLNIGSPSQRFDVFAQDLTADAFTSNSPNPATTGEINLASTDTIAWRNAANSADVLLSKSQAAGALPADTLQWPNGISSAEYITATVNPSTTGVVRLATSDAIKFRNNANSGDLNGLSHNSDDTVQVGDTGGLQATRVRASTGIFTSPTGTGITIQPEGTAGNGVFVLGGDAASGTVGGLVSIIAHDGLNATGGAANIMAGNAVNANGGTVTITGGNSTTSAVGGSVVLVPGSGVSGQGACVFNGTVTVSNKIANYNGSPTAGNGATTVIGSTSQRNESALDANLLTLTPPATAGTYRITFSMAVSAQNTATLGWTATWKDSNGQAQNPTNLSLLLSGTAAPALTFLAGTNSVYYGEAVVDIDNSSTNIVVKLTFTGTSFTAKCSANIERLV